MVLKYSPLTYCIFQGIFQVILDITKRKLLRCVRFPRRYR